MSRGNAHYNTVAAMLAGELAMARETDKHLGDNAWNLAPRTQTTINIIRAMADIYAHENPRFVRDRFYKACGYSQK